MMQDAPGWMLAGAGAVLGAVIGSFIATLVLRWGRGEQVAHGRSRCDHCALPVPPQRLIPVVSWLLQRGRCAACRGVIDPIHLLAELLGGGIGGAALALAPGLNGAALALGGWQLLTLALLDARYYWLPHRLSGLLALTGLLAGGAAMAALGLAVSLSDRLIGAGAGFVALWAISFAYRHMRGRQGLGGGDPPLLGALGAWFGWMLLPQLLLLAALAGFALVLLRQLRGTAGADWRAMRLPLGSLLAVASAVLALTLALALPALSG